MLFDGKLQHGKEMPLVEAMIEAGADLGVPSPRTAHGVPVWLLHPTAEAPRLPLPGWRHRSAAYRPWRSPENRALLGQDRLTGRLIEGSDLNLKDAKYKSPPLGWAIHGWSDPPAGNRGRQLETVVLLVAAGAMVEGSGWNRRRCGPIRQCSLRCEPAR